MCAGQRSDRPDIRGRDGKVLRLKGIRFDSLLPAGANATVVCGVDTILRRDVVVKFWNVQRPGDTRNKATQALMEARKLAAVDHPGIVRAYSCGLTKGVVYLVMEHLKGVTLADTLRDRELPVYARERYWRQIFLAIDHAYTNGIYHGDLHLRNVMVVDGTVKVIDFGTSVFSRSLPDARRRDKTLLRRLFLNLLPEAKSLLAESNWRGDSPEIALLTCNTVAMVDSDLRHLQVLLTRSKEAQEIVVHQTLCSIAVDSARVPCLPLPAILTRMASMGLSDSEIKYFAHECLTCATLMERVGIEVEVDHAETARPTIEDYINEHAAIQTRRAERLVGILADGYKELSKYV